MIQLSNTSKIRLNPSSLATRAELITCTHEPSELGIKLFPKRVWLRSYYLQLHPPFRSMKPTNTRVLSANSDIIGNNKIPHTFWRGGAVLTWHSPPSVQTPNLLLIIHQLMSWQARDQDSQLIRYHQKYTNRHGPMGVIINLITSICLIVI